MSWRVARLPPGFPAVEIDGEHYWDGGLVSNTPLHWVVDAGPAKDTLVFQVDLWSARGELPRNLTRVAMRQKEIQYSSRTRAEYRAFQAAAALQERTSAQLLASFRPNSADSPEVAADCAGRCERKV